MAIDNPVLLGFCNESLRPFADLLAGIRNLPADVMDAVAGKGLSAVLGTTDAALLRSSTATPWTPDDYAAVAPHDVTGSDSAGRTLLTSHRVIALIRVAVFLREALEMDANLGALVATFAVNPRAR
jgi:hypothetical protein